MSQVVIGIFRDEAKARHAVDVLLHNGFNESDIDLSDAGAGNNDYPDNSKIAGLINADEEEHHESGIARFFRNLFGKNDESEKYTRVAENGCMVTVYVTGEKEAHCASGLLDENGAIDVDEHYHEYHKHPHDSRPAETINPNATSESRETVTGRVDNGGNTIPVVEEKLFVGKKVVESGGVRIRSRIVEEPIEKTIRLREEKIRVERNAVNRQAHPSDIDNFREETLEVRERKEVPKVSKEAKVVKEISADRVAGQHDETIPDTVRRNNVDVNHLDDKSNRNNGL